MSINLLPSNLKPNKAVVDLSKKVNKAAVVSLVVLVVLGIFASGYLYVISSNAQKAEKSKIELMSQMKALEREETSLILIKDRISKIANIRRSSAGGDYPLMLREIAGSVDGGSFITKAQMEKSGLVTTFDVRNSDSMEELANILSQSDLLEAYDFGTFLYRAETGYEFALGFR
jgi:Tfp pilus assembly protein PilN